MSEWLLAGEHCLYTVVLMAVQLTLVFYVCVIHMHLDFINVVLHAWLSRPGLTLGSLSPNDCPYTVTIVC